MSPNILQNVSKHMYSIHSGIWWLHSRFLSGYYTTQAYCKKQFPYGPYGSRKSCLHGSSNVEIVPPSNCLHSISMSLALGQKYIAKCLQTYCKMSANILQNVSKHRHIVKSNFMFWTHTGPESLVCTVLVTPTPINMTIMRQKQ